MLNLLVGTSDQQSRASAHIFHSLSGLLLSPGKRQLMPTTAIESSISAILDIAGVRVLISRTKLIFEPNRCLQEFRGCLLVGEASVKFFCEYASGKCAISIMMKLRHHLIAANAISDGSDLIRLSLLFNSRRANHTMRKLMCLPKAGPTSHVSCLSG